MPYIQQTLRPAIDDWVAEAPILQGSLGELNYVLSRIINAYVSENVTYSRLAGVTGVLENVKQEFYRRVIATYEDLKIHENGDIPQSL